MSSFSTLDLRLAAHTNNAQQVALHVKDLFKVEVEGANSPALEFIANSRKKSWPPFYPSTTKRKDFRRNDLTKPKSFLCRCVVKSPWKTDTLESFGDTGCQCLSYRLVTLAWGL